MSIIPVILAGGSGTRLWPLSRIGFPKQFLSISGDETLFQEAISRVKAFSPTQPDGKHSIVVVTNDEHRFLAQEQVRELRDVAAQFLLEPVGKNTAPALTLAALQADVDGADPILIVTPADQTIINSAAFLTSIEQAIALAKQNNIVTLGILPTAPETGYGYIRHQTTSDGLLDVAEFVEKPDLATAQAYLESGQYLWNSGIFVLKAQVWLKALQNFRPDIYSAVDASWQQRQADVPFIRPDKGAFAEVPSESIDYAVMELCPGSNFAIKTVPLDAGWSDLGAWDAVWQTGEKDAQQNVTHGDVLLSETENTLVHASGRLVSVVGGKNLVVVETADAVLVADKNHSQNVKHIVEQLKQQGREEQSLHRKVHRPWGWYDSIDEDSRFKVKRIQVKPGASLSLQKHYHRAEHWIVVSGTAEVTCGEKVVLLGENQSIYIPLGEVHRLANPGKLPLEIIEVQSGSYLGEDDIVRYQDCYGRSS